MPEHIVVSRKCFAPKGSVPFRTVRLKIYKPAIPSPHLRMEESVTPGEFSRFPSARLHMPDRGNLYRGHVFVLAVWPMSILPDGPVEIFLIFLLSRLESYI